MLKSIRGQLFLLTGVFTLFIMISAAISYMIVVDHRDVESQVDILNDQILLVHQLSAAGFSHPQAVTLDAMFAEFEANSQLLIEGGTRIDEDGARITIYPIEQGAPALRQLADNWQALKQTLIQMQSNEISAATIDPFMARLQVETSALLETLFSLSSLVEEGSEYEHLYLIYFEMAILGMAFPLMYFGYRISQKRIIQPLTHLNAEARRIGDGQLEAPVRIEYPNEIGNLAAAFDDMRLKINHQHVNLETRVAERTLLLQTVHNFSQEAVKHPDMEMLFESAVDKIKKTLEVESVSLCLISEDHQFLKRVATTTQLTFGDNQLQPIDVEAPLLYSPTRQARISRTALLTCDHLKKSPDDLCVTIPLSAGEHVYGALCAVRNQQDSFNDQEVNTLTLFANAIATSIENDRLNKQIQHQVEKNARQREREQLAAEIHDSLSQTLAAIRLQASSLLDSLPHGLDQEITVQINNLTSKVNTAQEQLRLIISHDSTGWLELQNLVRELKNYIAEYQSTTHIPVHIIGDFLTLHTLPPIVQRQVFLIIREALINISKHASAKHVQLHFHKTVGTIEISISDDGIGFDPGNTFGESHLGLRIMRTRAERSGGIFQFHSRPGLGTTITICYPVQFEQNGEG